MNKLTANRIRMIRAYLARLVCVILCLFFMLAPLTGRAENLRVLVLLSDSSTPYQSFASTLTNSFPATVQATVQDKPDMSALSTQIDLIVSVGMKASVAAMAQSGTPVLTVMIPKAGYDELLAQPSSGKTSAIYLDQPWDRQLDFVRAVLPNHRKIGLLYSPLTHIDLAYFKKKVSERDSTLVAESVSSSEGVFSSLSKVLEKCEVLLAVPDNSIYNSSNIRNILLSSYRHETPFIGLSQSYVTAGALGAIFTTPQQLSDQAAATIIAYARTGEFPKLQYPREFTFTLNHEVARSLDIELPSADVIRNRMNNSNSGVP